MLKSLQEMGEKDKEQNPTHDLRSCDELKIDFDGL